MGDEMPGSRPMCVVGSGSFRHFQPVEFVVRYVPGKLRLGTALGSSVRRSGACLFAHGINNELNGVAHVQCSSQLAWPKAAF